MQVLVGFGNTDNQVASSTCSNIKNAFVSAQTCEPPSLIFLLLLWFTQCFFLKAYLAHSEGLPVEGKGCGPPAPDTTLGFYMAAVGATTLLSEQYTGLRARTPICV